MEDRMNITNNTVSQHNHTTKEYKGLIPELPFEVKQVILSNFNDRDLRRVSCVNTRWRWASTASPKKDVRSIQHFANVLANYLPASRARQKARLVDIKNDNKIFSSFNITGIRQCSHKLKEEILDILKDLSKVDLDNLEEFSKREIRPVSFESIFELAKLYNVIKDVNFCWEHIEANNPEFPSLMQCLSKISIRLVSLGDFDKAIQVADTIQVSAIRDRALVGIIVGLLKIRDHKKASQVASTIDASDLREFSLSKIPNSLIKNDKPNRTMRVCEQRQHHIKASDNFEKAIQAVSPAPKHLELSLLGTTYLFV